MRGLLLAVLKHCSLLGQEEPRGDRNVNEGVAPAVYVYFTANDNVFGNNFQHLRLLTPTPRKKK